MLAKRSILNVVILVRTLIVTHAMKTALISGVSGQDGSHLAKLLLGKGYRVCGTSRDTRMSTFGNLERLGIRDKVQLESVALNDFRSVLQVLF